MSAAAAKQEIQVLERRDVAATPMDLLTQAVANGNIELAEKLMTLQERWEANQARKSFDAAVAAAKAELKPVIRNRQGHNQKKYTDFAAIASAVDPIISKHGLSYRFKSEQGDRISVTCILTHKDGHSEQTTLSGPADNSGNKNAIQAIGSTLTYLQRYSLVQMLGIAAADDDDGRTAVAGEPITQKQADALIDALEAKNLARDRFLKWVRIAAPQVQTIEEIPLALYDSCVEEIARAGKKS